MQLLSVLIEDAAVLERRGTSHFRELVAASMEDKIAVK